MSEREREKAIHEKVLAVAERRNIRCPCCDKHLFFIAPVVVERLSGVENLAVEIVIGLLADGALQLADAERVEEEFRNDNARWTSEY